MIDEMTGKSKSAGHQKRQHVDHEKASHETDDGHNHRVSLDCTRGIRLPRRSLIKILLFLCHSILGYRWIPSYPQQP